MSVMYPFSYSIMGSSLGVTKGDVRSLNYRLYKPNPKP